MKKFIIFGVSSFLSDIIDIIHANDGKVYKIYMNMKEARHKRVVGFRDRIAKLGYEVEIYESMDEFQPEKDCEYTLGAPSPHKCKLVEDIKSRHGLMFKALVHPTVHFGSNVHMGEGVQINVRTVLGPNAYLDDFCTINRNVSVGHDTRIGKYALIGPGTTIGGSGQIGEKSTIGMRACIFDRIHVGSWAVIGAGSLVTKDVEPQMVAYGSPAKPVRKNEDFDLNIYKSKRDLA